MRLMEADPQLFDECREHSYAGARHGHVNPGYCFGDERSYSVVAVDGGSANHKEAYDEEEQP